MDELLHGLTTRISRMLVWELRPPAQRSWIHSTPLPVASESKLTDPVFLLPQVTRAVAPAAAAAAPTAARRSLFSSEQRLRWSDPTEATSERQRPRRGSRFPADRPYCWWRSPSHCRSGHCRLNGDNTRVWSDPWLVYCYLRYVQQQVLLLFPQWTCRTSWKPVENGLLCAAVGLEVSTVLHPARPPKNARCHHWTSSHISDTKRKRGVLSLFYCGFWRTCLSFLMVMTVFSG